MLFGDGDATYGEYGTGQDFTSANFTTLFSGISNDLSVARVPMPAASGVAEVAAGLDRSVAFEREVGTRKDCGLFTAGRITLLLPADSWEFVVKPLVAAITNSYPSKVLTTVVQVSTGYTDRSGIDYAIESDNLAETQGQVVIPEDVPNRLGLASGAQFIVVGENDVVILKTIRTPSMAEFDGIIRRARSQARTAGMTADDVIAAEANDATWRNAGCSAEDRSEATYPPARGSQIVLL
jgi:bifunctional DNA-binding transcriptional regulator/antitoxin component of YhaV-PrlF toxin-antitoxin module